MMQLSSPSSSSSSLLFRRQSLFQSYFDLVYRIVALIKHPSFSFLADKVNSSCNMFQYITPFMFPAMTNNAPVNFTEKQPQLCMFPPPNNHTTMMFLRSRTQLFFPFRSVLFKCIFLCFFISKRVLCGM